MTPEPIPPETTQVSRSGVLPVDKGAGLTSFQVVAHLRRLLRAPKIGHGGTLDPAATASSSVPEIVQPAAFS